MTERKPISGSDTYERFQRVMQTQLLGHGLKARVFRGGAWLGLGSLTEQMARFTRNMILVRLLAPAAFGTMAIVLSVTSVLTALTEIGVREALIQNPKGAERQYVGSAWWMAFGRGVSLYVFLALIAPLIARFYGNWELTSLLRVAVISVLLESVISTKAFVALKQMKFSKWAVIFHGGGVCGVLVTLVLSLLIRDVWALVIGFCSESAARCALSYLVCPYMPPLKIDKTAFRELLKFSRGLFGLSFLNLIYARTDIFVLAKLLPAASLGVYSMAIYLAQVPTNFLLHLMGQVLMPTFSHIQGDSVRTNRILLRVTALIMFVGTPVVMFMFFCAGAVLKIIYGAHYVAGALPLMLASSVALLDLTNAQITGVFYATGHPQLHRRCVAAMALVMISTAYPLAKSLGPSGGQLACLISMTIGFALQAERIRHVTGLRVIHYWALFVPAAGAAAFGAVVCSLTRHLAGLSQPLSLIGAGTMGCVFAYGIMCAIVFRTSLLTRTLFTTDNLHDRLDEKLCLSPATSVVAEAEGASLLS